MSSVSKERKLIDGAPSPMYLARSVNSREQRHQPNGTSPKLWLPNENPPFDGARRTKGAGRGGGGGERRVFCLSAFLFLDFAGVEDYELDFREAELP